MARLPIPLPATSPRLERALLVRVLAEPYRLGSMRKLVTLEDFSDTISRRVFEAILVVGAGDLLALHAELARDATDAASKGWAFALAALADDAIDRLEEERDRRAQVAEEGRCAA